MRRWQIFTLTHFYPLFIAGHLYFGDWCRWCQLMFNIVPIVVFGGLILIWKETSQIRLSKTEKFYLKYFLWNLSFIYCYYCICVFSPTEWIYNKNWQVSAFVLITLIFYTFNYRERK